MQLAILRKSDAIESLVPYCLAIDDKSTPTDKFARIGYLKFRGDVIYDASSDGGCSATSFANSAHAPRRINYSRGWA